MENYFTILPDRAVLRLTGPDRLSFLQGVVTQDVSKLADGNPVYTALLTPQGKFLHDFFLHYENEDAWLLETDANSLAPLLKRLTLYKLRAKVNFEEVSDYSVAVIFGGHISDHWPLDPRLATLGARLIGKTDHLPEKLSEFSEAGFEAYNDFRLKLGIPEGGRDMTPESLFPLDANMDVLNGVSYKKGCFVGQEVASRMKRKGEIRKRILCVEGDAVLPAHGTPIMAGDSTIGEMLSAQGKYGLAFIRLERWRKADNAETFSGDVRVKLSMPAYLEE